MESQGTATASLGHSYQGLNSVLNTEFQNKTGKDSKDCIFKSNRKNLTRRFIRVTPPGVQCCEIDVCRGRSGARPAVWAAAAHQSQLTRPPRRIALDWSKPRPGHPHSVPALLLGASCLVSEGHQTEIEMFCGATAALSACYIPIN